MNLNLNKLMTHINYNKYNTINIINFKMCIYIYLYILVYILGLDQIMFLNNNLILLKYITLLF